MPVMAIEPNDYALVVGVNHYLSGDLKPLSSAVRDAMDVERWLLDQGTGGGLLRQNCRKIVSEQGTGQPVNDMIDDAFAAIFAQAKQGPIPARRFYFYFSGHGMAASLLQTYLCLPKWSNERRRAALDSEDYWLMVAETGYFQEIVCLFDCCRSYKPNVGGVPSTLGQARPNKSAAQTRLFVGFAAEFLHAAFEDPTVDGHSFFTRALLSGLRGGACEPTGGAPAQRLKGFLETETKRLAELSKKRQSPMVFNGFPTANEPVFGSAPPLGGNGAQLVYLVSVTGGPERSVVLVRPDNSETPWNGSQPWRIAVGGGLHLLQDKANGKTFRLPRDITQGEIHVDF